MSKPSLKTMIELEPEKYEALLRRLYDAEDAVGELVRGLERIHEASIDVLNNEFRTRDIAVRLIGRYKRDD
jgi:hypothetical protein